MNYTFSSFPEEFSQKMEVLEERGVSILSPHPTTQQKTPWQLSEVTGAVIIVRSEAIGGDNKTQLQKSCS